MTHTLSVETPVGKFSKRTSCDYTYAAVLFTETCYGRPNSPNAVVFWSRSETGAIKAASRLVGHNGYRLVGVYRAATQEQTP